MKILLIAGPNAMKKSLYRVLHYCFSDRGSHASLILQFIFKTYNVTVKLDVSLCSCNYSPQNFYIHINYTVLQTRINFVMSFFHRVLSFIDNRDKTVSDLKQFVFDTTQYTIKR